MGKFICLALLLTIPEIICPEAHAQSERTLAGIIYFTNNTPRDMDTFPVALYTRNQKRRLAATKANAHGEFKLMGLRPGKYLLKFTWPPNRCVLWYKIDVRRASNTSISVIMDAACAHQNGAVRELPTN